MCSLRRLSKQSLCGVSSCFCIASSTLTTSVRLNPISERRRLMYINALQAHAYVAPLTPLIIRHHIHPVIFLGQMELEYHNISLLLICQPSPRIESPKQPLHNPTKKDLLGYVNGISGLFGSPNLVRIGGTVKSNKGPMLPMTIE